MSISLRSRTAIARHSKGGGLGGIVNDINPFDGNNGAGLGGYAQDLGSRYMDPWGIGYGDAIMGDSANGGGLLGGFLNPKDPKKPGGGAGDAYMAQAQATVEAANIAANASRDVANAQLAGMQAGADAQIKSSQMGMMGGVLGAALGAHTTTEQIKQWTPTEAGSQTIQSWDLAQKWNKTLQMRTAGYQDAAINYELSGKDYKSLFSDPQWNSLKMMDMTKKDMMASAQTFGIRSAGNPGGVDLTEDVFLNLMSFKNPDEMLQVDPAVAQARNAQFANWEKSMKDQGMDLITQIVRNPQLAGSSILTMKGKDPLIDESMAGFMGTMMTGQKPTGNSSGYDAFIKDPARQKFTMIWDPTKKQHIYVDPKSGQEVPKEAYDRWAAVEQNLRNTAMSQNSSDNSAAMQDYNQQKGMWDQAIDALTKGEKNQYTDQIKQLMDAGVIDKYGMINAGALSSFVPPELMEAPEFSPYKQMDPQTKARYQDQYRQMMEIKVDPKLIREETLGNGLIRKTKLNADGTVSSQAIEGQMLDMMGNSHYVSMQGRGMQDWNNRQMMLSGNPFRPGMRAATNVSAYQAELQGNMGPSSRFATANNGFKGSNSGTNNTANTTFNPGNQDNSQVDNAYNPVQGNLMPMGGATPPKPKSGSTGSISTGPKQFDLNGMIGGLGLGFAATQGKPGPAISQGDD